ncbi:MAG: NAD(P)H-quinone oxidoreductase [Nocardioidaceae bacterium]
MRGVMCRDAGGPEVLEIRQLPDPQPGPGEVVVAVAAGGVNRADIMQRQGFYPPPPGESEVLGLECSGTVESVGEGVTRWVPGDPVCALLAGGGQADRAVVPEGQLLPVSAELELVTAASLPEVVCTVWSNVFTTAALQPDELLLVHGGSSGIGTMAIQLAKAVGARVACTVGSAEKADFCTQLGADLAINYHEQDFAEEVRRLEPAGANVILDIMGAAYLGRNVDALATEGRLVVIGLQGGAKGELNLRKLLGKRAAVIATSLRARPRPEKAAIVASVTKHVWPLLAEGKVRSVIHDRIPLEEVRRAHELLESSEHIGKLVLTT